MALLLSSTLNKLTSSPTDSLWEEIEEVEEEVEVDETSKASQSMLALARLKRSAKKDEKLDLFVANTKKNFLLQVTQTSLPANFFSAKEKLCLSRATKRTCMKIIRAITVAKSDVTFVIPPSLSSSSLPPRLNNEVSLDTSTI